MKGLLFGTNHWFIQSNFKTIYRSAIISISFDCTVCQSLFIFKILGDLHKKILETKFQIWRINEVTIYHQHFSQFINSPLNATPDSFKSGNTS